MAKLAESNKDLGIQWKFVYIQEAHAMDEWPLHSGRFNEGRGPVIVEQQPTEAPERCRLAQKFGRDFGMDLESPYYEFLVDNPELGDPFEKAYAPWPLRLYLLRGTNVDWIAQAKECSFVDAIKELVDLLGLFEK